MKKLDVPLILQEKGSADCGPVCVQMVLQYFKINTDLALLKKNITYVETGTSAYDNALLLIDAGLKVKAVTAQPLLFSPDTIPQLNDSEKIITRTEDALALELPKEKALPLETMILFINQQGEMQLEIPSLVHIKESIDNGNPVIALIHGGALGSEEGGFHFVVVNGYDDERISILNPKPGSKGENWCPKDDFFYALHSATTSDYDNGSLLIIST